MITMMTIDYDNDDTRHDISQKIIQPGFLGPK